MQRSTSAGDFWKKTITRSSRVVSWNKSGSETSRKEAFFIEGTAYEWYPLGDRAIVIRWNEVIGEPLRERLDAAEALLGRNRPPAIEETARAYTSITVYYDPWLVMRGGLEPANELVRRSAAEPNAALPVRPVDRNDANGGASPVPSAYEQICAWIHSRLAGLGEITDDTLTGKVGASNTDEGQSTLMLPVVFGGNGGPDLAAVAAHAGLTEHEVIELYCSVIYTVHMIGFTPGFPYLGGLPERLAHPRRAEPRAQVPAGSVGIAGKQTGIYPAVTPGGWQLIGWTPLRLFDPSREQPSLLRPGSRVRFEAVDEGGWSWP